MRKLTLCLSVFFVMPSLGFGQCQVANLFPPSPTTPAASGVTIIANNSFAGSEYCVITNITNGHVYEITHANGAYITIRDGSVGGAVLAMGFSPLSFTSTSANDVYVHFTVDAACTEDASGAYETTVQDLGTPPCDLSSSTQHPANAITPDPGGAITTIATDQTGGGQYSVITGVQTGHHYEFTHSGGAYMSAFQGSIGGTALGAGQLLAVVAITSDDIYLGYNADEDCNTDPSGAHTTTVRDNGIPPCDMSEFGGQYPFGSITPDPGGAVTTIATDQFVGSEYSVITGLNGGTSYEIIHEAGSFITVRAGAVDGPVLASGYSPLTVNVFVAEDLYVHWSVDEFCNELGSPGGFWGTSIQDVGGICPLSATLESVSLETCEGEPVDMSISFGGNAGPVDFLVTNGTITVPFNDVTSSPFTFPVVEAGTYTIVSANDGVCEGSFNGSASLVVHPNPTIELSGGGVSCDGTALTGTATMTGTGPWSFIILRNEEGSANNTTHSFHDFVDSPHDFTIDQTLSAFLVLEVTDAHCTTVMEDTVFGHVSGPLTADLSIDPTEICEGENATITVDWSGNFGLVDFTIATTDTVELDYSGMAGNTISVPTNFPSTYSIINLEDSICTGEFLGPPVQLIEHEAPTATLSGGVNCDGTTVQVTVHLTGTAPWNFTSVKTLFGNPVETIPHVATESPYTFDVSTGSGAAQLHLISLSDAICFGVPLDTLSLWGTTEPAILFTGTQILCPGEMGTLTVSDALGLGCETVVSALGSPTQLPITISSSGTDFDAFAGPDTYIITSVTCGPCFYEVGPLTHVIQGSAEVTATFTGGGTVCNGGPGSIEVAFTGLGPWWMTMQDISPIGGPPIPLGPYLTSPQSISITSDGLYQFSDITDPHCSDPNTYEVAVDIVPPATAALVGEDVVLCSNETFVPLTINLGGEPPWNLVMNNSLTGNFPLTAASSPYPYLASEEGEYSIVSVQSGPCDGVADEHTIIVINDHVTGTLTGDSISCDGSPVNASIAFTGQGPWTLIVDTVNANGSTLGQQFIEITDNPLDLQFSSSGNYEITSLIGVNCDGEEIGTLNVSIFTEPVTATLSGQGVACFPDSVLVSVSFSGEGPWNFTLENNSGTSQQFSSITENPLLIMVGDSGTYSVSGVSSVNCPGEGFGEAEATIHEFASITADFGFDLLGGLEVGFSDFSGPSGVSYSWTFGDGEVGTGSNPTHTYDQEGSYEVCLTVTSVEGCVSTHCQTVNVMIDDVYGPDQLRFSVYPNPSSGSFNIKLESFNNTDYSVSDISGRVIEAGQFQSQTNALILDASKGTYILRLSNENGVGVRRLVVE